MGFDWLVFNTALTSLLVTVSKISIFYFLIAFKASDHFVLCFHTRLRVLCFYRFSFLLGLFLYFFNYFFVSCGGASSTTSLTSSFTSSIGCSIASPCFASSFCYFDTTHILVYRNSGNSVYLIFSEYS